MQDMARRRRKRGAEIAEELVCEERGRQAAIAAHTMFQGFLNAMDNSVEECSAWSICEAGREAGERGRVGGVVARVSGHQAAKWLKGSTQIERAAAEGAKGDNCDLLFPCS